MGEREKKRIFALFLCIYAKKVVPLQADMILVLDSLMSADYVVLPIDQEQITIPLVVK